jgi:hypothetical protein
VLPRGQHRGDVVADRNDEREVLEPTRYDEAVVVGHAADSLAFGVEPAFDGGDESGIDLADRRIGARMGDATLGYDGVPSVMEH